MECVIAAVFTLSITNVFSETPVNNSLAKYDAAELLRKIFNTNDTILPRANYGLIQFEGSKPDFVNFETQSNLKDIRESSYRRENSELNNIYEPSYNTNFQNVVFQDNVSDGTKNKKRKKRKPRQHSGLIPGNIQSLPYAPGYENYYEQYPPYDGQYYRPSRPRPRPSLASEALSAVTEALTSIALYDDYQCVPRLLCEAAAGGSLGSSGLLQTVSGLQPLLTLLSAYSGLTSNPLFVFGRAVLLGAASHSNPATCRYAYTACPTDPEQLVHYLNNHNGGFFRFFNAPQQGQQNIEQFYNQLSQNYGLYQPNQEYNQNNNQQNYGSYNPNLYSNHNQNYGLAYPYQNNAQHIRFKSDYINKNAKKIEKRIQNKPNTLYIDDTEEENPRWTFPEGNKYTPVTYVNNDAFNSYDSNNYNDNRFNENNGNRYYEDKRKGKVLKFPNVNNEEEYILENNNYDDYRGSFFPEQQDNRQYYGQNNHLNNHYYDNKNYDNRQNLDYNIPTKHNNYYDYDNKYNNRQTPDYSSGSINNIYNKYHSNRLNQNQNTPNQNNFENKYVTRDEYYANEYYANKNKYNNDNYVNNNNYNYNNNLEQGVQTVYVVRGNGDPSNPEIHKLRPGQTVY